MSINKQQKPEVLESKKQAHQKILQIASSAKKIAIKIKIIMPKKKNVQAICLVMIS